MGFVEFSLQDQSELTDVSIYGITAHQSRVTLFLRDRKNTTSSLVVFTEPFRPIRRADS